MVALNPDVIVANATPAIAAAQKSTSTIPIVMAPATNPLESGFVRTFTQPGRSITGCGVVVELRPRPTYPA
ncbi:hypothetical protein IVA88_28120 [Bradyrhizobium sp. 149]|nr:hypothetical protein [Bradyrhizobium sp. 149]